MLGKEIISFIEQEAPLFLQEDYDNSGLQWGNPEDEVQKVLVCLDFTLEALRSAKKEKAQMVISHHPILFRPMKSIHTGFGKGEMLAGCIREDICVYAAHTNFDVAKNGLNGYLAAALELQDIEGLKMHYQDTAGYEYSLGKVGKLKDILSVDEFTAYVKEKLQVQKVRTAGNSHRINRVAVFCGSFDGDVKALQMKKVDALVTGDLKYHDAQDLEQAGIFTVDAGHYHTEKLFIQGISGVLKNRFKDVIIVEHYGQDVFQYR